MYMVSYLAKENDDLMAEQDWGLCYGAFGLSSTNTGVVPNRSKEEWRGFDIFVRVPHTPPQIRPGNPNSTIPVRRSVDSQRFVNLAPVVEPPHFLQTTDIMADSLDYVRICESCPPSDGWGPAVTTDTTLNGVPYAPFSKGDKLGRMADWTAEGKDRERGGRMQYNRSYRGEQ